MLRRTLVAVAVAAVSFLGVPPGPAQAAKPLEHVHYGDSASFNEVDCGLAVHVEVVFSGVFTVRVVKGSDGQAFFGHDNYEFTATVTLNDTDPTTNEFVTLHGNGNFVEQHATHLGGNIWEFQALDAGTFTLRDSDGNALIRDRGVVKLTGVFDLLGDGQPGGILLDEQIEFHGPHSTEEAFCAAYVGALT